MSDIAASNPFVGLRPFESEESLLFFGRQEQTLELLQRLHAHHFVAVVGSSGSGKSSLIRAGLIPRLKAGYLVDDRDRWKVVTMKPGQSPVASLATALLNSEQDQSPPDLVAALVSRINEQGADALLSLLSPLWEQQRTNVFLLVDQFEELFRYSEEKQEEGGKDEATDFVNILLGLARQKDIPVYIVLTMRSDFIGDCSRFYGLPEALNESQYLVPRLTRVQLRTAIEGPVRLYGETIQPALSSRLLNDLGETEDELPLLQHCLMRVWDHHHQQAVSGPLGLEDYLQVGGIEKALSNHADEALNGMTEIELSLAKTIFQTLTAIDANARKIRRPAPLSELNAITGVSDEVLLRIINRFIEDRRSFLILNKPLGTGEIYIDISHESLIRQWITLNNWVDEEAEASRTYLQLVESGNLYRAGKKDLMSGLELQLARKWYENFHPRQPWAQRYSPQFKESIRYLQDSQQQSDHAELKARSQKKRKGMLVVGLPAFFILLLLLLAAGWLNNQKEAQIKEAFRLVTQGLYMLDDNPTASLRIVQSAISHDRDSLILSVAERIYLNNLFYKTILPANDSTRSFVSMDGSRVMTTTGNKEARIWQRVGMKLICVQTWNGSNGGIRCVAFSSSDSTILTGSDDHIVRLWTSDGKQTNLSSSGDSITEVAFAPNGKYFMSSSGDGKIRIWDLQGNFHELKSPGLTCGSFFPHGDFYLTGSKVGTVFVWDSTYKLIDHFGQMGPILSVAISGNGGEVITGSKDKTVQVWSLNNPYGTGQSLEATLGHNTPLNLVKFSPNSQQVFAAGSNGNVRIWIKSSPKKKYNSLNENWSMQGEMKGILSKVSSLGFSSDGDTVITTCMDGSVRLWDISDLPLPNKTAKARQMPLDSFLTRGAIDSFSQNQIDSLINYKKITSLAQMAISAGPAKPQSQNKKLKTKTRESLRQSGTDSLSR